MKDFAKPNPIYWFKPEFARPKEIPDRAKIRYYIIKGKRKRVKVWSEQGYSFVAIDKIIWRTYKTTRDVMADAIKDNLIPKIQNLFERDDSFYAQLKRRQ